MGRISSKASWRDPISVQPSLICLEPRENIQECLKGSRDFCSVEIPRFGRLHQKDFKFEGLPKCEIPQKSLRIFSNHILVISHIHQTFIYPDKKKYLVSIFTYIYHTKLTIHVSKYIIPHWVEMGVFVGIFVEWGFSAMKNPMVKFQVHVAEWVEGEKLSQSQAFQLKMWGCDRW